MHYENWLKFLLMVAMANYLVASLLWDLTTKMDLTLIERGNLRIRWATFHLRYESQQQLNAKFVVNINIGNSWQQSTVTDGSVKRIPPDTAIHEQMAT